MTLVSFIFSFLFDLFWGDLQIKMVKCSRAITFFLAGWSQEASNSAFSTPLASSLESPTSTKRSFHASQTTYCSSGWSLIIRDTDLVLVIFGSYMISQVSCSALPSRPTQRILKPERLTLAEGTKTQVIPFPIVKSKVCLHNYCFRSGPFTTNYCLHFLRASKHCFRILPAMHSFSLFHAQPPAWSPKSMQCKSAPRYCEIPWVLVVWWFLRMANTSVCAHEPPWLAGHQSVHIIQRFFAFPKPVILETASLFFSDTVPYPPSMPSGGDQLVFLPRVLKSIRRAISELVTQTSQQSQCLIHSTMDSHACSIPLLPPFSCRRLNIPSNRHLRDLQTKLRTWIRSPFSQGLSKIVLHPLLIHSDCHGYSPAWRMNVNSVWQEHFFVLKSTHSLNRMVGPSYSQWKASLLSFLFLCISSSLELRLPQTWLSAV